VLDLEPIQRLKKTLELFNLYLDEAQKCRHAGAPLAGSVLLASAMEAALLAMVQCFPGEVGRVVVRYKSKELSRPASEWGLSQLLLIARTLGWLPSAGNPEDRLDPEKAGIGDYVEVIRAIRNLVHPSIYLRECPDKSISEAHLDLSFRVLEEACAHLSRALSEADASGRPGHTTPVPSVPSIGKAGPA